MFPTLTRFTRVRTVVAIGGALALAAFVVMVFPADTANAFQNTPRMSDLPRVVAPKAIHTPMPSYTPEAMRQKIAGRVELEVVVGADGKVEDARIVKSLDQEFGLDQSALEAAKRWEFRPGTLDGTPLAVIVSVEMSFTIH